MKNDQPSIRSLFLGLLCLPLIASLNLSYAQTTASPATPSQEVIELSEFRVDSSRDSGYLASNATSGTRLNMPIKELPMQLEVITRDFIEDIGAIDFKEALDYSAGVVQDALQISNNFMFSPSGTGQTGANALRPDGTALNIRGYNTRFVLRNGFRLDTVTDVINLGRQELVRGPQALLYGVSALGGIVNVIPRYPTAKATQQVRLGYGSNDFQRAEYYASGPWVRKGDGYVNFGLGILYQKTGDYTDFNERTRKMLTPSIDWRLTKTTNLFFDFEFGEFETEGAGFKDVSDANPGPYRNEYGLAVTNLNPYNETITVARDNFGKSTKFRWSGDSTYEKTTYRNYIVELTQKLLDDRLTVVIGGNINSTSVSARTLDSQSTQLTLQAATPTTPGKWVNAGPNPLNPAQNMWKTVSYQWALPTREKTISQFRADLNYTFEAFGGQHNLLGGYQDQSVEQTQQSTAQVTNNIGSDGNRSYQAWNDLSYITYQDELVRPFRDNQFWEWNSGYYVVYNGRFWNDRFTAIAGYRWDRYMVRDLNYTYVKSDTSQPDANVGNWVRPAGPDNGGNSAPGAVPQVNGYRFGGETQYENNPNAGLSYRINDNLNVYVMSGRGVFPNTGQRDGAGDPFEAERTKGSDIGLKADLWKNEAGIPRVSVQLAGYEIERENGIYNVFWAPQPRSNNRARPRSGVPADGRMASGTGPNAYSVYSSGWSDFEESKPVTYLLPVQYVAPADLTHPRVDGAPKLNNFILVDYSSLGTAAADPLRRAMDAAANDSGNFTALQTANTGSGATGLYANNPYALNRNSDVAYDDKSQGIDLSVILNLSANYSATLTYAYIKQEVTGGFRVVDQAKSTEYDSWWNYMGIPLEERRTNLDEAAYDFSGSAAGMRTIDAPEQQVSMWNRYALTEGMLKGFDVGLGVTWRNERQGQVALDNGVRTTEGRENVRLKPEFPSDTKVNMALGYRTRINERTWRFQVNVSNLLDDQKDQGNGSSLLYINPATGTTVSSTTAGAQAITVPERSVAYYAPRSFRFTASVSF